MKKNNRFGKVFLVGAGPGDPELITIKAVDKIKNADVVVYDRLIGIDILNYCREDCEKIFVGKESGFHLIEQEEITKILIEKSRLGLNVVRLKGGNPYVFGRGSEEAIGLQKAGIEFEVIPGVTSGTAAPTCSGIPVTHRGLITQCVFVTGHECPDKPESQVDWKCLANMKNTSLIIYMGLSRIESICTMLIKYGMDTDNPAAVIENGTMPNQRTITGTVSNIAKLSKEKEFKPPCLIMISPTITLRNDILGLDNS